MAGAFLSASLQVLFDRLASREVLDFIHAQKLSDQLLGQLERKMQVVDGVLNDAEVKQFSDPAVRMWLVHVKDVVYDAEDLLDEIATEALRWKMEAADDLPSRFSPSVESRVLEMIAKLQDNANEIDELGLKRGDGEKLSPKFPSACLVDEICGVFGRDGIKDEMIERLLSDNVSDNKLDVISIVGGGGSGKTTLAQLLYKHEKVKQRFPLKAWVYVSEEFLLSRITKLILEQIGSYFATSGDVSLLQSELKEKLGDKKFLLVLDGVGDKGCSEWNKLLILLQAAGQGSKVVFTTRSENVAKTVMGAAHTYHLEGLSPQDSWSLFVNLAFENGKSSGYPELESIGKEIVKKCQGLPLAVKAMGSLLRFKAEKKEWDGVLNNEMWELPTDPHVLPSLLLSYGDLPLHLKRCLAYCSIFPRDREFEKEKLILLWMAEGLVQPCSSRRMEEVGALYFRELVSRSFFQKSITKASCFVIHDLIHDLAQHISGEFCVLLEEDKVQKEISEKTRHLFHFKNWDHYVVFERFEALSKVKHLRTFLELSHSKYSAYALSKRVLHDVLPQLRCLRVLTLCSYGTTTIDLPDSIGNLRHLRYLDLSGSWIKELPESICNLYNLQMMILSRCGHLFQLPTGLGKLINLRYLDISETQVKEMPSDIGQLQNLQTLSNFIIGHRNEAGIGELSELLEIRGRLCISEMQNLVCDQQTLRCNMKDKKYLEELKLEWDMRPWDRGEVIETAATDCILDRLQPHVNLKRLDINSYKGGRFPDWIGDPSFLNLVSVKLFNCYQCLSLPPLGQLPSLKHLRISAMERVNMVGGEFYGNGISTVKPSFPSLQTLRFEQMFNWERWLCCGSRRGEFPHLQELHVCDCPKLTGKLPKQLRSLKILEIVDCPRLLVASLTVPAISKLRMLRYGALQLKKPSCGFRALKTTYISISNLSQWKQLPVELQKLSITEFDFVESLLEEGMRIDDCCSSRAWHKMGLPNTLKSLSISNCTKLEFLVPQLLRCPHPFLEVLTIHEGICADSLSISFSSTSFPRLTYLEIEGVQKLKYLSALTSEEEVTSPKNLRIDGCPELVFVDLSGLGCTIIDCLKLKLLKLNNSSIQRLSLHYCPVLMFQMDGLPSNLCQLTISNCNQLTPQVDWGLQRVASLTNFIIKGGCQSMESFPQECLLPSTLTCLQIRNLPNLKSLDSKGLQHLLSLKYLVICSCPRLQSLSGSGLQNLIALKSLGIHSCPELQSFIDVGLQHLLSLETLCIHNCPKLQYFTKQRLSDSLSSLVIKECPLLEKWCQFGEGQGWGYIAHIPHIVINDVLF